MYTIKLFVVMVQNTSTGPGQAAQKGLPWKSGRLGILKKTPVFSIKLLKPRELKRFKIKIFKTQQSPVI